MNLCFICREYPPAPRTGGIGSATRDQARALARLGHGVHVVAPAGTEPGTTREAGVVVHRVRVPRRRVPGIARVGGHTLDRLGWSWAAARAITALHRAEGLDVVEAPEFAAEGVVAAMIGRRAPAVVVRLHTPLALVRRLNGTPLTPDCRRTVWLERAAIGRAATVTAPSRAVAAASQAAGYGAAAGAARVIPYSVDPTVFAPDPPTGGRGGSWCRSAGPLVLFPGRLEARKGIADVIEALPAVAARVPDARFAFVGADTATAPGGGSWRRRLEEQVTAAGLGHRVHITGFLPREKLPAWYRAASVVVAPSPFEALGIVYLEAMACARPVVGCAAGAFPEVVTDGCEGRAVPPHDPGALADVVVDLLEDPAAPEMGRRGRRRVLDAFAAEPIAARTAALYAEVAGGGSLR